MDATWAAGFEQFLAAAEPGRAGRVRQLRADHRRVQPHQRPRPRAVGATASEETFILRGDPPPGSGVFTSDRDAEWELLQRAARGDVRSSTPAARWYDAIGRPPRARSAS